MELENELPWKKPCYECKRIIEDVRKFYIQRYANKFFKGFGGKRYRRPIPTSSTNFDGKDVCLDCSPENPRFNLIYDETYGEMYEE
tara:strand:+ start:18 stop:275 length:258 start_codon:yes stop_codon:yes gene_type:complete